jgi:hypothetical protein
MRYGTPDFADAAKEVLEAQNIAARAGSPDESPRYATFSVWQPVKPVRRDPVAVCARKSILSEDFAPFKYRAPSLDGEYLIEAYETKSPRIHRRKDDIGCLNISRMKS